MTEMSRRAFSARALGAAAVGTAAAAGLAPAARAQTGSLGGSSAPTSPGTPAAPTFPTDVSGQPAQLQGTAVTSMTPQQLAELDTSYVPTPSEVSASRGTSIATSNSPFRSVATPSGAYVMAVEQIDTRTFYATVWSPSNQRAMRVGVMTPGVQNGTRPTLYMLDGYQDWRPSTATTLAEQSAWYSVGGGHDFFMDKNVNVVFACDPGPSMYRDCVSPLPNRGPVKWETFLTKELPPLVDQACGGNGRNGIVGISSGATAAFMTAVRNRNLYTTVVGLSGVYDVDNTFGKSLWSFLWRQKNIDPAAVMGGWFNSQWMSNDPYAIINGNTQSLRGKTVYISASSGLATADDWVNAPSNPNPVLLGGPFEATAFSATLRYGAWLNLFGVKVTQDYRLLGVHDWPLWRRQLPLAWPTIAKGLGVDGRIAPPTSTTLR